ncbi:hypothetical protein B0F90DRAFT_1741188, partial [Multifurca ochricompacta]
MSLVLSSGGLSPTPLVYACVSVRLGICEMTSSKMRFPPHQLNVFTLSSSMTMTTFFFFFWVPSLPTNFYNTL